MYSVVAYSLDGVKREFLIGVSLEDADWFYTHHHGCFTDENGFEWALKIERC